MRRTSWIIAAAILCLSELCLGKWQRVPTDDRRLSAFDMLTSRTGLFAVDEAARVILVYENNTMAGVFVPNGKVTSLLIKNRDTAFASVTGDGIYMAVDKWQTWRKIAFINDAKILDHYGNKLLVQRSDGSLHWNEDDFNFSQSIGNFPVDDTVRAAVFVSKEIAFACGGKYLYRSSNGGKNWEILLDTLRNAGSLYFDDANGYLFIGGKQILRSADSGASFTTLTSIIFFSTAGQVFGTKDCSGVFYVGPDSTERTEMLRSQTNGRFFQEVGLGGGNEYRYKQAVIFDRGSTFYWLNTNGILSVSRDGCDGTIPDSVSSRILAEADTGIIASLCAPNTAVPLTARLRYDECTGVVIDSLRVIGSTSFTIVSSPKSLFGDEEIEMQFRAAKVGVDSAVLRIFFRSLTTELKESRDIVISGVGTSSVPVLVSSHSTIDFDSVKVDSTITRTFRVFNSGCDTLRLDSMISSNSELYTLTSAVYPKRIAAGDSATATIRFTPNEAGRSFETVSIYSSVGKKNVAVTGTGVLIETMTESVDEELPPLMTLYPNPTTGVIYFSKEHSFPIVIRDALGRVAARFDGDVIRSTLDISHLPSGMYFITTEHRTMQLLLSR